MITKISPGSGVQPFAAMCELVQRKSAWIDCVDTPSIPQIRSSSLNGRREFTGERGVDVGSPQERSILRSAKRAGARNDTRGPYRSGPARAARLQHSATETFSDPVRSGVDLGSAILKSALLADCASSRPSTCIDHSAKH